LLIYIADVSYVNLTNIIRFYCRDMGANGLPIHISQSAKCDGIADCQDESDEMGCSIETHFYCKNFTLPSFIRRDQVNKCMPAILLL